MGNQCCAGRDSVYKKKAQEHAGKGGNQSLRQMFSFGAGDDVVRFDRAYDNDDIDEFVKLCLSTCEIEKLEEHMHPWASDPETIGALAATQLAIFASHENNAAIKEEIREAGGIQVLVELLRSKERDRLHAAVVALSFLSVDSPLNCHAMYDAGALPLLVNGMKSDIDGMCAACAQAARNIYVLDIRYRRDFVKAGGVTQLVWLLAAPADPVDENFFTQLEAIYHLEDLIMDGTEELPEFVSIVKKADAVSKLKNMRDWSSSDIREVSNLLVIRLVD